MATTLTATGAWTLEGTNTALEGRMAIGALLAQADSGGANTVPMKTWRSGVLVTQSATIGGTSSPLDLTVGWSGSGMNVAVYAGAWVCSRAGQGPYLAYQQLNGTFAMDPGHAVNNRKDRIIAEVLDSGIGDAGLTAQIRAVKGAEDGSNVMPALPTGAIHLAQAQVNANVSSGASVTFTDGRNGTMLNGGVRILLGGDSLTDPGYRVGELRYRKATGTLPDMLDTWGYDQKWHGTKSIVYSTNPAGGANIGGGATNISLGSISIADPGWDYKLKCDASLALQLGTGTKYEVSFRDGSASGTEISGAGSRTTWDRGGADTAFTYYYKTVQGTSGTLTGAKTIHLGALKTAGVNGIDMAGAGYSSMRVEVIPV